MTPRERLLQLQRLEPTTKRAACFYEACRHIQRSNKAASRFADHLNFWKLFEGFMFKRSPKSPHWLELNLIEQSAFSQYFEELRPAYLREVTTEEDRKLIASDLTETKMVKVEDVSTIAFTIRWEEGLAAVAREIEKLLSDVAPDWAPGAGKKPDLEGRGKRSTDTEINSVLGWLAVAELQADGVSLAGISKTLRLDRKTCRESRERLAERLHSWFGVHTPLGIK